MPPRLMDGEQPIILARQHWHVFIPVVAMGAAAIVAAAVVGAVTPSDLAGVPLRSATTLVLLAAVVVSSIAFSMRWLRWRYQTYVLTDRRILVTRGVLSRSTESVALDRIQDSCVRRTLLSRMLGYGDVEVESAGRDGASVLIGIADPEGFGNGLLAAVEARRAPHPATGATPGMPQAEPPWYGAGMHSPPAGYGPPRSMPDDGV